MIPRQWLVSCHRKRASAEAHQSVSNPRAMPPMLPWRRPLWERRRRRPSILARHGLERFGRQRTSLSSRLLPEPQMLET